MSEKCERCGSAVQLMRLEALIDMVLGQSGASPVYTWVESESTSSASGFKITAREHTRKRCDAARSRVSGGVS